MTTALGHIRICDFAGHLAGAGATRFLAAFGAQVIRVEDPTNQGRWDILRGGMPHVDGRRGINLGGSFNNHNVEKLGITLDIKSPRGRELLERLIRISDAVTESFAGGVMERLGFGFERLKQIKPDIIYVSNCGFGQVGPRASYKTWGPSVQALSGLTFSSGRPGLPPAGWGYSYMDHTGGYYMCMAVLLGLYRKMQTGEGCHVDYSTIESAITLNGPALLEYTVNGRPMRREGSPDSTHSDSPPMAPHAVYPGNAPDRWLAIACRDDADWKTLTGLIGEPWAREPRFATLEGRLRAQAELDELVGAWTAKHHYRELARWIRDAGVPAAPVNLPEDRVDHNDELEHWGLWPTARHTEMGPVRVDGYPVHFSETDWQISHGAPCLGEHNEYVYRGLLGLSSEELAEFRASGVI